MTSAISTWHPSRANNLAIAAPVPTPDPADPAPVTIATFASNLGRRLCIYSSRGQPSHATPSNHELAMNIPGGATKRRQERGWSNGKARTGGVTGTIHIIMGFFGHRRDRPPGINRSEQITAPTRITIRWILN